MTEEKYPRSESLEKRDPYADIGGRQPRGDRKKTNQVLASLRDTIAQIEKDRRQTEIIKNADGTYDIRDVLNSKGKVLPRWGSVDGEKLPEGVFPRINLLVPEARAKFIEIYGEETTRRYAAVAFADLENSILEARNTSREDLPDLIDAQTDLLDWAISQGYATGDQAETDN